MKLKNTIHLILILLLITISGVWAAENADENLAAPAVTGADTSGSKEQPFPIFDDKMLLEGYAKRYKDLSKDILLEMIKDDTVTSYKMAAAIRAFRENYSDEVVSHEKSGIEKILLRRLNRTDSSFVQVEVMYTLCVLDRYRYFPSMVPPLIQKLDHYN